MDVVNRRALEWWLSIDMETDFCVVALPEAMDRQGQPEIFNADQGVQFTSSYRLDGLAAPTVHVPATPAF
jgi:putative transposase